MAKHFVLIALFLFISSTYALQKATKPFTGTDDLFDFVLKGDHEIYVLFFFNSKDMSASGNQELSEHVGHERQELAETLQTFGDNVFYAEVDTGRGDFNEATQALSLSSENLKTYPATIVLDDSNGIWITGPNEAYIAKQRIEVLLKDPFNSTFF